MLLVRLVDDGGRSEGVARASCVVVVVCGGLHRRRGGACSGLVLWGDVARVLVSVFVNGSRAFGDVVADTEQRGWIDVGSRDGDRVLVSIADAGGGVPEEIADRAFDLFFTAKEVGRGTGQGLAIARPIVVRDGGELTFEDAPGYGTMFTTRLPFAYPRDIPSIAGSSSPPPRIATA